VFEAALLRQSIALSSAILNYDTRRRFGFGKIARCSEKKGRS
jgi:hypothetical protein